MVAGLDMSPNFCEDLRPIPGEIRFAYFWGQKLEVKNRRFFKFNLDIYKLIIRVKRELNPTFIKFAV